MYKKNTKGVSFFIMIALSVITVSLFNVIPNDGQVFVNDETSVRIDSLDVDFSDVGRWKEITMIADQDLDGMSDSLERKLTELATKSPAQPELLSGSMLTKALEGRTKMLPQTSFTTSSVPVVVSFPSGNIASIVSAFTSLGGELKSWYDVAINGFAGTISADGLDAFSTFLRENAVPFLVEEDSVFQAQLYYASRNMNLRPLAWSTYGFRGDPTTAVAVIDTGIDDSHAMFAPGYTSGNDDYKLTGWSDQVSGITSPYDDNGHGSHCSGIVAGSGNYSLDGSSRSVATYGMGYDYTGYMIPSQTISMTAARFNVTIPGTIDIDCTFQDSTSGDRVYIRAYLYRGETVVDSYVSTATSWTDTLTTTAAAGTLGDYSLRLEMQFYGADGYCDNPIWRFRGIVHWPFSAPALGSNNRWQGVAPDSRLVGIKVLSGAGSGTLSDIVDGINWAITNRLLYNITVISMSLGGSGGQTSMINAVNNAVNNGIVTVVAAGNDGSGSDYIGSPGDADNVITVAAMSDADRVTDFSSQGGGSYTGYTTKPDIMAPGGSYYNFSMFSVDTNDNDAETFMTEGFTNDMAPMLGTSMATPAVAGAANLVIDAFGGRQNWNFTGNEAKLVKALLLMTATETYPLQREVDTTYSPLLNRGGKDVHEGYGRINVDAAIESIINQVNVRGSISSILTSSSVSALSKHAMACHMHLTASTPYSFALDVPAGTDFDVYIYSGSASTYGEPVLSASGVSAVVGQDESFTFTPSTSGIYYAVVKAISGTGNATFTYAANQYPPTLSSPAVTPTSGTQATPFNFSVLYTDQDGNAPNYVRVTVNSQVTQLAKVDPPDNDYTNGCWYSALLHLQPATYTYSFSCNDGRFTTSTSTYSGPTVTSGPNTNAPMLVNATVSPLSGSNTTTFTFRVTYQDRDNNLPTSVTVTINSSTYTMIALTASDTDVVDGKTYFYNTALPWGLYQFRCNCSDGTFQNWTAWINAPEANPFNSETGSATITNVAIFRDQLPWGYNVVAPRLTSLGIAYTIYGSSSLGIISLAPFDKVVIESQQTTAFYNVLVQPSVRSWLEAFVSSGGVFEMHHYHYTSDDILGALPGGYLETKNTQDTLTVNSSFSSHPIVSGVTSSGISGWNPSSMSYLTGLSYSEKRIVYDPSLYQPRLFTRSFGNGLMIYVGLGIEWGVGHSYGSSSTLLTNLLLYTEGRKSTLTLTSPSNGSAFFNGNITFSWSSLEPNFQPIMYHWQLSNTTSFSTINDEVWTIPETTSNTTFTHDLQVPTNEYYWRVQPVYGVFKGNWSSANYFTLIYNNFAPGLSNGSVSPGTGDQFTTFSFNVTYVDLDNNDPTSIIVYINGTAYPMYKQNSSDTDYTDGCIYIYQSNFSHINTTYEYYYTCSDGKYSNSTSTYIGPIVVESNTRIPNLLNAQVSPLQGTNMTVFNFTVVYMDFDNNLPTSVTITINSSTFSMFPANILDINVLDGKTYYFTTTLSWGLYRFIVNCSDGLFQNATGWVYSPVANPFNTLTSSSVIFYDNFDDGSFDSDWTYTGYSGINSWTCNSTPYSACHGEGTGGVTTRIIDLSGHSQLNLSYWLRRGGAFGSSEYPDAVGSEDLVVEYYTSSGTWAQIELFPAGSTAGEIFLRNVPLPANAYHSLFRLRFRQIGGSGPGFDYWHFDDVLIYSKGVSGIALLGPVNGSWYFNGNVTFSWSSLSPPFNPITYHWQLSNSSTFSTIINEVFNIAEVTNTTSLIQDIDVSTGICYWRVRPVYSVFHGNWSSYNYFACIRNYYAPILNESSLSPTTGNQLTPFNFTVTYTDADDNQPAWIQVLINGTAYAMSKLNASDMNCADGVIYQYATILPPGSYEYEFTCGDGRFNASVARVAGPTVTEVNYNAPALSGGQVSPASGTNGTTTFTFSVVYTDMDNNHPGYVNVSINWWTFPMAKQNPADNNYMDGCIYTYSTTLDANWNYEYWFNCTDRTYLASLGPFQGPTVLFPSNFTRTWSGYNYDYDYAHATCTDGNYVYTAGRTNSAGAGGYDVLLIKWDQDGNVVWYRTWGGASTEYGYGAWSDGNSVYVAGYTNSYGAGSYDIVLVKWATNGTYQWYRTWGTTYSDYGYGVTGDGTYIYVTGTMGTSTYYDAVIVKWDANGNQQWSQAWTGTYYENSRDVYVSGSYVYISGYTDSYGAGGYDMFLTCFTTGGTYQWYRTWGSSSYEYGWGLTGDGAYIYASGYTEQTGLLDIAIVKWDTSGNLQWYRTWGGSNYEYAYDVLVRGTQIFIAGSTASYGAGVEDFLLVEYTTAGTFIKYNTWGTSQSEVGYGVTQIGGTLYIAGYQYSPTYYYEVMLVKYDRGNAGGIVLQSPTPGSTLYCGNITYEWSSIQFSLGMVNYTWQLSTWANFTGIVDTFTCNGSLVTTTSIHFTNVITGTYYWRVAPVYGKYTGKWTNGIPINLIQNFYSPILSNASVLPVTGNQLTPFNFTVTYTDADGSLPAFVQVRINGTTCPMSKLNATDMDYTDGVIYQHSTILPPGVYEYEFLCGDGRFNATSGVFTYLTVIEVNYNAPTLSTGQVSPTSGINGTTTFTFSVVYTDIDNNYPGYVNVSINWWTFPMAKQNPSDINYMDGCIYTYSTTLDANWNYEYWFNCTDRTYLASLGPFQGPTVLFPSNFTRTWSGYNYDYAHATCTDGNYVYTAGRTSSAGAGGYDVLLVKWDQDGNVVWYRTWGGASTEYGYGVWSDGNNVYVAGYTNSYGAGGYDLVLVKWDTAGSFQWYRTWGTTYADYGYGVTGDGTYIYATGVAGASSYNNAVLVKWDANGNQQWYQTWTGTYYEYSRDVYVSGSYVYISGETNSYGAGNYDFFLTCFTTSGSYQWYRTWGTTYADYGWGLTGDGTYIYASGRAGLSSGYTDIAIVKWDMSGNQQWYRTWGGSYYEYGYDVLVSGTQVFIAGFTTSYGAGGEDFLLVEYTTAGTFVKYNTWGTSQIEDGWGVCKLGSSLFIAGFSYSASAYYDVMLVRCEYGNPGGFSLLAPPSGASFLCGDIAFSWMSINFSLGMVNYTWQLSTSPSFATIDMEVFGLPGSSGSSGATLFVNVTTGLYYWRVAPSYGRFTGKWAAPFAINLVRNFLPPSLTGASYTPAAGHQMTDFTFQVVYTDRENNPALYVFVIINSTTYMMTKANLSDIDYTDGCVYTFTTKLLVGTYDLSFACSDGRFLNSTITYVGPIVTLENLYAPTMGSQQVTPITGTIATLFTFAATYYDNDNLSASFVRIVIDTSVYDMAKQNPADINYVDGVTYVYATTLGSGVHQYLFMCSDGNFSLNYGPFGGPIVDGTGGGGSAPTLTSASVTPSSGDQATNFQFSVTYTDVDNNAPFVMNAIINGTSHPMVKLISTDLTYTDGCVYVYSTTLAPGNYTYQFACSDGTYSAVTIVFTSLIVTFTPNLSPTLSLPSVTPTAGTVVTTFHFSVTYSDPENAAPVALNVVINGVGFAMSKVVPGDMMYSDGCDYEYQSTLVAGIYAFSFNCSDGYNVVSTESFLGLQVVDNAPVLANLAVSPTSGSIITNFVFTVTYIDGENQAPSFVTLTIDSTPFSMSKQNAGDVTYTDGCIYQYVTMLAAGSHSYAASCSDGRTTVNTGTIPGPIVTNTPPTLAMPSVSPPAGTILTTFIFTVTYTDYENQAPVLIEVSIDGIPHTMSKQSPSDNTYSDGCVYQFTTTLSEGVHSYSFSCSDGLNPVTSASSIVEAVNNAPVLLNSGVTPSTGNNLTSFQFSTTYSDVENQAPSFIRIVISLAVFDLTKVYLNDTTYTDGCLYRYTTALAPGTYNFTFTTSDGNTQVFSSSFFGFLVSSTQANRAPVLSIGQITVDGQSNPASCTFRASYQDDDNDAPTYIRAIIDGVLFAMVKEDTGDGSYVDGCTYVCAAYLVPGTHTYRFTAESAGLNATTGSMTVTIPEPQNLVPTSAIQNILIISIVLGTVVLLAIIIARSGNKIKKANVPSRRRSALTPSPTGKTHAPKSKVMNDASSPTEPGTEIPLIQEDLDNILGEKPKQQASGKKTAPSARGLIVGPKPTGSNCLSEAIKTAETGYVHETSTIQAPMKAVPSPQASPVQTLQPTPEDFSTRTADLKRANTLRAYSDPLKSNAEPPRAGGVPSTIHVEPFVVPVPIIVDDAATTQFLSEAGPVLADGKEIDVVADLRASDVSVYSSRWYEGPPEGMETHFVNEIVAPRKEIFGEDVPLSAIISVVRAMVYIIHGHEDPVKNQAVRTTAMQQLINFGAVDPNLPTPHLTDKGLVLRVIVLELSPEQSKMIATKDFSKIDENT